MSLTIPDFLTKKGAVEVLCEIDPNGSRFKHLKRSVPVSHQTLSDRLDEGVEVSLLNRKIITTERGTGHTYTLTPQGATFRRYLEESATVIAYRQFKQTRTQFRTKKHDACQWARTELPEFDSAAHEQHLESLQNHTTYRIPDDQMGYADRPDEDQQDDS